MDKYVVITYYQLLIVLLKTDNSCAKSTVVLDNGISEEIMRKLIRENIFEEVEKVNIYDIKDSKRFVVDKTMGSSINVYFFSDFLTVGWLFNKYKINYNVIEDGYNYFSYKHENFMDRVFTRKAKILDYKELFKHIFILRRTKGPGFSKYCQSIEVNDISVVPKDERYHKFKEVPRKDLFNNISEERKQLILRVFDVEELSEVAEKSVLILTQPLSIDGLMNSDDKQYGFYKKICDKYLSEGYEVYLKPHPRDTITYEKINGVNLIAQSVPMELIEMVSDVKFERIITHSSTAINFLTCGKEKEVFFDFNTREYDEKLLEKYNINKDEL